MRWPRLNSLLARLLIGSAIPLVLFVAVGIVVWAVGAKLIEALRLENHTSEMVAEALVVQRQVDIIRDLTITGKLSGVPAAPAYRRAMQIIERHGPRVRDRVADNPEQQKRIAAVLAKVDELGARMRAGQPGRVESLFREIDSQLDNFVDEERHLLIDRRARAEAEARRGFNIIVGAVGLALFLTLVLSYFAARSVTRPVRRLREAAGKLMQGQFVSVPPEGPTEVAELVVLFNHMALTLTQRTQLLAQQEQRYRTYVGAITHILWNTDPSGEVIADLPSWRAFTGQTEEEVRGRGWAAAIHPEDRGRALDAWQRAIEARGLFDVEYRVRSSDGEYRPFQCRAVPIVNVDGSVREWICTCTDISDEKRRAALEQAKEAAEAASRAKSEFLTRMSHELRTPLNAVIGMSRMLSTQRFGPLTAKQADYLADITRAGEHLLALINDILDLAKVESGKMEVTAGSFLVSEAVAALASTLRPLSEARGLEVRLEGPAEDEPVETDAARFRQVLYNLLSNAIKFTPAGGKVAVRWGWVRLPTLEAEAAPATEAEALRVAVSDTGIGISPENQQVVWDEFRQVRPQVADAPQGTGLGLALTRRLVALLGGAIRLESEEGHGSTFTFVIPRRLPQAAPTTPEAQNLPTALVVEDDEPTSKLLCDWLRDAGLSPVPAKDGLSGLEEARRLRPALIVLDVQLPRLDGWQLLAELKGDANLSRVPVVMVSVDEQRRPNLPLAVREFFLKPVDRTMFLERLRELEPQLFQSDSLPRILVVDDDPTSLKLLEDLLAGEGLTVLTARDGKEALERIERDRPDMLILDLGLPTVDGFAVIDAVRSRAELAHVPIFVITGRDLDDEDRQRLRGRVQALLEKHLLTPERFHEYLQAIRVGARAEKG